MSLLLKMIWDNNLFTNRKKVGIAVEERNMLIDELFGKLLYLLKEYQPKIDFLVPPE